MFNENDGLFLIMRKHSWGHVGKGSFSKEITKHMSCTVGSLRTIFLTFIRKMRTLANHCVTINVN
jgi:hypothetical protein